MMESVAVVIDAGYLLKLLNRFRPCTPNNRVEVGHFRAVADRAVESDEELFRIYCHHCPPYGGTEKEPFNPTPLNFGVSHVVKFQAALQDSIRLAPTRTVTGLSLRPRGLPSEPDNCARAVGNASLADH